MAILILPHTFHILSVNAHLTAKIKVICIFMCFLYSYIIIDCCIFLKIIFFGKEISQKSSPPPTCIFLKYIPKTDAGMRYAQLTDYAPIRPCSCNSTITQYRKIELS